MNVVPLQKDFHEPLPDASEAECAILGAILSSNDIFWRVTGFLKSHHFMERPNRTLFEIIETMMAERKPVNPITIKPMLPTDVKIGEMTPFEYVCRLQAGSVGFASEGSARAVVDNWAQVMGIARLEDGIPQLRTLSANATPRQVLVDVAAELTAIASQIGEESTAVTMADAIGQAMTSIDNAFRFKKRVGISTGIEAIDQLTGPWEPGQQIIVGGGTKQGKTALALQCAIGLAAHGPVWVYSGEMSVKQLAMREIARRTGIPVWRQKEGRISQAEWERLSQVRQEVERLPILIEKRRLTLEQIHQHARDLKASQGLAALVIDHVGLLSWSKENARRDEWEQSQIATRELKAIYEDLGVPGMSLVQLKKNTFAGSYNGSFASKLREAINRRPKYTDMMGAVERDADHVIIPFNARPIIAGIEPEQGSDDYLVWEDRMKEHETKAEIILALSREQRFPDRRSVEWHGETTSFGPPFVGKQESLLPEGY
jgi:replicative DNA helicase